MASGIWADFLQSLWSRDQTLLSHEDWGPADGWRDVSPHHLQHASLLFHWWGDGEGLLLCSSAMQNVDWKQVKRRLIHPYHVHGFLLISHCVEDCWLEFALPFTVLNLTLLSSSIISPLWWAEWSTKERRTYHLIFSSVTCEYFEELLFTSDNADASGWHWWSTVVDFSTEWAVCFIGSKVYLENARRILIFWGLECFSFKNLYIISFLPVFLKPFNLLHCLFNFKYVFIDVQTVLSQEFCQSGYYKHAGKTLI